MHARTPLFLGLVAGATLAVRERKARRAIERLGAAALETLLNAIEANDPETGAHVRRVAMHALTISYALGLRPHQQRAVERVALFHDIGKIHEALFDIVHEHSRLSAAERRAIATHPVRGAKVLEPLSAFYPELTRGVACHHERWDGTGYPRGLRGRRIPLESRIVAIADTFDAVSHTRRYRRGAGVQAALDVLAAGRGTQFDPELVDLALLPPVVERLTREPLPPPREHNGRRGREREQVPDISFRWRQPSAAAARVGASSGV